MQASIEFGVAATRYLRTTQSMAAGAGTNISFKLLILFLLTVYSCIAIVFPQLEVFRPVLLVAGSGLFMLVVELSQSRRSVRLTWPQGMLFILFLGVAFVSSFSALYARLAFDTTLDLAKVFLVYLLIENTIANEKRLRILLFSMVVGGLFPALGTISNSLSGIFREGNRAAWRGIFANPNDDAYAIAILVPIAFALMHKSRWAIRAALLGIIGIYTMGVFVTYSRGGLLGLFAMACLIGWKQKSALLRTVMIAALAGSLVLAGLFWERNQDFSNIQNDTTFRQRIATIVAGILMWEDHPFLGVGPNSSLVAYPLYVPKTLDCGCQAQLIIHNSFVQVLSEVGILGFLPFMALLGVSLWDARKLQQKGSLGSYGSALEIALWGFVVCSLSGGFAYSWWPYIIAGVIAAAKRISDTETAKAPA